MTKFVAGNQPRGQSCGEVLKRDGEALKRDGEFYIDKWIV